MHVRWSCIDLPPEAPSPPSLHVSWAGVSHTAFDLAQHSEGASLSTFHSLHPPPSPHRGQRIVRCLITTSFLSLPWTWVSRPTDETRCKWHLQVQTSYLGTSLMCSFTRSISAMRLPR